jgi:hypothetical protein
MIVGTVPRSDKSIINSLITTAASRPAPVNQSLLWESLEARPIMAKAVTVHTIVILV